MGPLSVPNFLDATPLELTMWASTVFQVQPESQTFAEENTVNTTSFVERDLVSVLIDFDSVVRHNYRVLGCRAMILASNKLHELTFCCCVSVY